MPSVDVTSRPAAPEARIHHSRSIARNKSPEQTLAQIHARLFNENWEDLARMTKRLLGRIVEAVGIELVEIRRHDTVRTRLLVGLSSSPKHRQVVVDLFPAILPSTGKDGITTEWPRLICQIAYREVGLWGFDAFSFDDEDGEEMRRAFHRWCDAIIGDLHTTLKAL